MPKIARVVRQFHRQQVQSESDATVYYGDQTWDEMHFPSYGPVLDDPGIDPRRVVRSAGAP